MKQSMSETEILTEIATKLDTVVGFLAVRGIEDDQSAMVKKLSDLGLHPKVIASVTGLTENAIQVRLTRLRKKARRGE